MKVHGATMLVYLAMLGRLLTHIRRATALKANRLSGFSTLGLNGILALSGWLLYYASEDAFRQWSSTIHWTIGLASLPLLGAHVLLGRGWATRRTDGNKDTLHKRKGLPSLNRGEKHRRQHG